MTLEKTHITVGIISAVVSMIASVIVYAVAFGEMRSDVKHLQSKIASLESKLANSHVANEPTKIGICEDLFLELRQSVTSSFRNGEAEIRAEIEKLDCYKLLPDISRNATNGAEEK